MNLSFPAIPANAPVPTAKSRSTGRALAKGLVVGLALGIGVAGGATYIDRDALRSLFSGFDGTAWAWVLFPLAVLAVILVHELGHVVGGLGVGFRFVLLVVGPLRLERTEEGRFRLGLNKDAASAGGLAALHPEDQRDLARRFGWLIAAGPLASVLFAVVCAVAVAYAPQPSIGRSFLAAMALCSTGIALATATPTTTGYYLTDGARLLQLWKGGPAADRDAATLSLIAENAGGTPVARWHEPTVMQLLQPVDGSVFEMQGRSFAYMYAIAHGQPNEASRQIDRAIAISAGLPPLVRVSLDNERAYLDAMHGADHAALEAHARRLAADKPVPGLPPHARHRTLAALAAARGDAARAREHIAQARGVLEGSKAAKSGGGQWELDRLREIEARLVSGEW